MTGTAPPRAARARRNPAHRGTAALLAAFCLTRVLLAVAAGTSAGVYDRIDNDVVLYQEYGQQLAGGRTPYGEVDIEYPPVLLPFVAVPALAAPAIPYGWGWVALMVAVDAAGFAALLRLGRRWGSDAGAWWWVALLALLGPLVYTRFDLIPAVAAVWAVERASAGRWAGTGGWLAVGALAKLWPGFLVPATLAVASRPRHVVAGGAVVTAGVLLPFVTFWPDLAGDVLGYHASRGIQVESVWANALLVASKAGYPVEIVRNYGAAHLASGISPLLKVVSTALSVAALAFSALWAHRHLARDDSRGLAAVAFALIVVLVTTGSVLSPQFLVWVAALAAVTQADPATPLRTAVRWLAATAAVNHTLYPNVYRPLVQELDSLAIGILTVRNVLLAVVAWTAVTALAARYPRLRPPQAPPPARPAPEGAAAAAR